jgi:enolase
MIKNIKLYSILNSKGSQTAMVKVWTSKGCFSASVPSGTSKGKNEAMELPFKKVSSVFSKIRPDFIGLDESDPEQIDILLRELDPTENFSRTGGNLSLAISIAVAKASTENELWKLAGLKQYHYFPFPLSNIIGGGMHSGDIDWQEFLILPVHAKTPEEAVKTNIEIWNIVGEELRRKGHLLGRNIENAWMADLDYMSTLNLISKIAEDWGARIGIDFAASSLWNGKGYAYRKMKRVISTGQQRDLVSEITTAYNLYYIEDPFHENDFESFAFLMKDLKGRALIVGDDLYCTNTKRLETGLRLKSTNSVVVKPNQIGTLSLAYEFVEMAHKNKMIPVMGHRSGETEDPWLSDLAIAWMCPIIKIGILNPDLPKSNRLMELWNDLPNPKMAELR